jgi:choline dehydrogenase-like flavoprotein
MFKVRFATTEFRPDLQITLRAATTGWNRDHAGSYQDDAWEFELDEDEFAQGSEFKFVLERSYWMTGNNLFLQPAAPGQVRTFDDGAVKFPPIAEVVVENGRFQQLFFQPRLEPDHVYDVLVIGSGIGGGVVADQLADLGADVLVLEAGSALFTTHTGNLPRQHQLGKFDKHLWSLFDEYKVVNYVNAPGSNYGGGQAFNLGGRSVFWGAFIPRMSWWELEAWPQSVSWDLENFAYQRAEDLMYWPPPPGLYQQQIKALLDAKLPAYSHFDAPVAVRQLDPTRGTIAPGIFSTADLLTEGRLSADPVGLGKATVNLNHAAIQIQTNGGQVTGVVAYDLIANKQRTYKAKQVILAAGTVESTKLARLSGLANPNGLVGTGFTDHPVLFTHFSIPTGAPRHRADSSSKTLSQHKQANASQHPYNVLLELGADLNQGRYLDSDTLARHRALKGDAMLCEIVFLFNAPLMNQNRIDHEGASYAKPIVTMAESPAANDFWGEVNAVKEQIILELGGQPLPDANLDLKRGGLGGVAHEVGTLRLGAPGAGVVDTNLKYNGYENLYVCDLSVFPTSPAANPTLTLAALAIRLADHLKSRL